MLAAAAAAGVAESWEKGRTRAEGGEDEGNHSSPAVDDLSQRKEKEKPPCEEFPPQCWMSMCRFHSLLTHQGCWVTHSKLCRPGSLQDLVHCQTWFTSVAKLIGSNGQLQQHISCLHTYIHTHSHTYQMDSIITKNK